MFSWGVLVALLSCAFCLDTDLSIYSDVQGYPCTSLADKDGTIGCRSSRNGNSGPLWPLESQLDVDDFVKHSPHGTNVLLMNSTIFTKTNVMKLISTGKTEGILVLPGAAPLNFSPVDQYPNKKFGLHADANYVWNPLGDSFAFEEFTTPMFVLDSQEAPHMLQKARKNKEKKGDYPQYGVTLHAWMHPSGNAEVCLRRGQCQPLGGKSVWSSLTGPVDPALETIIAASTLDSNSFFHDLAFGANADVSGVVALLLAAEALSKVPKSEFSKQILFTFFGGEAWGYLGSKRFVADIQSFECKKYDKKNHDICQDPYRPTLEFTKIKLDQIVGLIEVGQVGNLTQTGPGHNIYMHKEKDSSQPMNNPVITALQQTSQQLGNVSVTFASSATPGIPPSSSMAFLAKKSTIPNIVLTEYDTTFKNRYYHSRFDATEQVSTDSIAAAALLLARTLYTLSAHATNTTILESIAVNKTLGAEFMYCLTHNYDCVLVRKYFGDASGYPLPSQYTSVYRENTILTFGTAVVYTYLFDLLATSRSLICDADKDCKDIEGAVCLLHKCVTSATYYHDAKSLAFASGTNKNELWETESTWTEANWDQPYLQVFKMESPSTEIAVFVVGALEVITSFVVIYFLKKQFAKRFKSP